MRFRSIQLKNFQAHKETEVEFSPSISTIIGPTDVGKSAVLRALRWACLNDLTGDGFVREGSKTTDVILHVMEKKERFEIRRTKGTGGSSNTYELEGKEFKAFGQGVPDDINALLRVTDINFQSQYDPPFWFTETAGEVSRRLNSIVDLTLVDLSLANIATAVRDLQGRKTLIAERLTESQDEYSRIEPQLERVKEFKQLKAAAESVETANEDCDNLDELIAKINTRKICTNAREEQFEEGHRIVNLRRGFSELESTCDNLSSTIQSVVRLSKIPVPPPFDEVEAAYEEMVGLSLETQEFETLISNIVELRRRVESGDQLVKAKEEAFHKRIKGQRCPLCQNPIQ